jgi:hypothetical protein
LPAHVTREEAVAIVLVQFKRTVAHTMELLELIASPRSREDLRSAGDQEP